MQLAALTVLIFAFMAKGCLSEKGKSNQKNCYAGKYLERKADKNKRELKGRNELLEVFEVIRISQALCPTYDKYKDYVLTKEQREEIRPTCIAIDYFEKRFLRGRCISDYILILSGKLTLQWGYLPLIVPNKIPESSFDENGRINSDFLWESNNCCWWEKLEINPTDIYKKENEKERKRYIEDIIKFNKNRKEEFKTKEALASKKAEPYVMEIPLTNKELEMAREIVQARIKEIK